MCIPRVGTAPRRLHRNSRRKLILLIPALIGSLACGTEPTAPTGAPVPDDEAEVRRVASVVVSPAAVTLDSGEMRELTASAYDARGRVIDGAVIDWSSLDANVATVSAAGVVTATRAGTARVHASSNGFSDTSAVTVVGAGDPTPPPTPAPPADVIFHDDFESGSLGAWQDGVNPVKHRVVNDAARASGGSRYLEITYPAGGEGGWLTRFFMPGHDSLYVRYDVQFDEGWQGGTKLLNIRGSRTDDQWSSFGKAGQCPNGSEWFATNLVMLPQEDPGPIRFYTYFPGMQPEGDGVTCWGRHSGLGVVNYTGTSTISRGAWHRVEFWIKLNTPGQSNGTQRVWVDGQLRGEWTGLALRHTNLLKLNSITLEGSLMGGTQVLTRRLMVDNVVVAHARSN